MRNTYFRLRKSHIFAVWEISTFWVIQERSTKQKDLSSELSSLSTEKMIEQQIRWMINLNRYPGHFWRKLRCLISSISKDRWVWNFIFQNCLSYSSHRKHRGDTVSNNAYRTWGLWCYSQGSEYGCLCAQNWGDRAVSNSTQIHFCMERPQCAQIRWIYSLTTQDTVPVVQFCFSSSAVVLHFICRKSGESLPKFGAKSYVLGAVWSWIVWGDGKEMWEWGLEKGSGGAVLWEELVRKWLSLGGTTEEQGGKKLNLDEMTSSFAEIDSIMHYCSRSGVWCGCSGWVALLWLGICSYQGFRREKWQKKSIFDADDGGNPDFHFKNWIINLRLLFCWNYFPVASLRRSRWVDRSGSSRIFLSLFSVIGKRKEYSALSR